MIAVAREERIKAQGIAAIDVGTYASAAGHAHGRWEDMPTAQLNYRFYAALAPSKGLSALRISMINILKPFRERHAAK